MHFIYEYTKDNRVGNSVNYDPYNLPPEDSEGGIFKVVVGEEADDEGYRWLNFCRNCWPKLTSKSPEEIYTEYSGADLDSFKKKKLNSSASSRDAVIDEMVDYGVFADKEEADDALSDLETEYDCQITALPTAAEEARYGAGVWGVRNTGGSVYLRMKDDYLTWESVDIDQLDEIEEPQSDGTFLGDVKAALSGISARIYDEPTSSGQSGVVITDLDRGLGPIDSDMSIRLYEDQRNPGYVYISDTDESIPMDALRDYLMNDFGLTFNSSLPTSQPAGLNCSTSGVTVPEDFARNDDTVFDLRVIVENELMDRGYDVAIKEVARPDSNTIRFGYESSEPNSGISEAIQEIVQQLAAGKSLNSSVHDNPALKGLVDKIKETAQQVSAVPTTTPAPGYKIIIRDMDVSEFEPIAESFGIDAAAIKPLDDGVSVTVTNEMLGQTSIDNTTIADTSMGYKNYLITGSDKSGYTVINSMGKYLPKVYDSVDAAKSAIDKDIKFTSGELN